MGKGKMEKSTVKGTRIIKYIHILRDGLLRKLITIHFNLLGNRDSGHSKRSLIFYTESGGIPER